VKASPFGGLHPLSLIESTTVLANHFLVPQAVVDIEHLRNVAQDKG
jgi:hypothetical protein